MKILQIVPYFYPSSYGGTQRIVYELGSHLSRAGHEVAVLTTDSLNHDHRIYPHDSSSVTKGVGWWETVIGKMHVRYYLNINNRLAFSQRLFLPYGMPRDISRLAQQYDIIHIHEYRNFVSGLGALICRRHSLPHVMSVHGGILRMSGRESRKWMFDMLMGKTMLKGLSGMVALTDMEKEQYLNFIPKKLPIEIIPNGMPLDEYCLLPDYGKFREKSGIGDRPLLVYLGRLHHIKGLDFLIGAYGMFKKKVANACLAVVGPDDGFKGRLVSIIHDQGLSFFDSPPGSEPVPCPDVDILFLGLRTGEEKRSILRDSELLILPSRMDNFPAVPFEAIMMGSVPIITDRCGTVSIIEDQKIGGIAPFGDEKTLAEMMERLLKNPGLRKEMIERGRAYINEKLNWETVTERYIEFYERILDQA